MFSGGPSQPSAGVRVWMCYPTNVIQPIMNASPEVAAPGEVGGHQQRDAGQALPGQQPEEGEALEQLQVGDVSAGTRAYRHQRQPVPEQQHGMHQQRALRGETNGLCVKGVTG